MAYTPRSEEGEARRLASIPKGRQHWRFSQNPTRGAIHKWLNKWYGKATECVNSECDKTSTHYEWAKIKGKKYTKEIKSYMPLCRKCHTKYDMTSKRKSAIINGIKKRYNLN